MKYLYCSGYCNLNKCSSIKYICSLKITTQNEFYFQNSVFLLYHFLYSNTVDQNCHFWMPSNKNFQMHYYWLCNVDDYTQMKDIILITKFWKKKNPLEVRTLYYNLHIQVLQELRGARRNVDLTAKRHLGWKGKKDGDLAKNNSEDGRFAPSACCPSDRLKLVPTTDHHSCCTINLQEMHCSYTTSRRNGKET